MKKTLRQLEREYRKVSDALWKARADKSQTLLQKILNALPGKYFIQEGSNGEQHLHVFGASGENLLVIAIAMETHELRHEIIMKYFSCPASWFLDGKYLNRALSPSSKDKFDQAFISFTEQSREIIKKAITKEKK